MLVVAALLARPADAFDFSALEQLIREHQVRSIEDLLPLLPASLRSRYVLVFASRSLQGASFEHPRVILFDPDARFVLSFNGDAARPGFAAIETMAFDDATATFRLREVEFPDPSQPDTPVRFSAVNPAKCSLCHGDPARPVWDSYPFWPGAYGERYGQALSAAEKAGLARFLREQPTDPRYRQLLDVERFADEKTFLPHPRRRYEGGESLPPNGELGEALGRLNAQALVHELAQRPQFETYKYALLGAMSNDCGSLGALFPPAQRAARSADFARLVAASAQANAREAAAKQVRSALPRSERAIDQPVTLDRLRYVVETGFAMSTDHWTLALEKGTYDFAWSPSTIYEVGAEVRGAVARSDPEIADLAALHAPKAHDGYCAVLARHSRAAIAAEP
jgi:hypothetical protein